MKKRYHLTIWRPNETSWGPAGSARTFLYFDPLDVVQRAVAWLDFDPLVVATIVEEVV